MTDIFRTRLLWRRFTAGLALVRDIMSKDVQMVCPDTTIKVVATMNKFDTSSIIVVRGERPVGIITIRDVLSKEVVQCLARKSFDR